MFRGNLFLILIIIAILTFGGDIPMVRKAQDAVLTFTDYVIKEFKEISKSISK